jgi:hypothetical protein
METILVAVTFVAVFVLVLLISLPWATREDR